MGNKQNKQIKDKTLQPETNLPSPTQQPRSNNQKDPSKQGCCGGCFGGQKKRQNNKPNQKQDDAFSNKGKSSTIKRTHKSRIRIDKVQGSKVDNRLFENREGHQLKILLQREEPYQCLRDEDYIDSQQGDRRELQKLKKVYDNCEIANYKTPETQKLQTATIKTYLFDRNLTKLEA